MKSRILLVTFGSFGDLNPFLGIARELKARGLSPVIASNEEWRIHVERAGIEFRAVRAGWDVHMNPNLQMATVLANGLFTELENSVADLLDAAEDALVIVSLTLAISAPIVARKLRIPWASVVLEPLSLFSTFEPLLMPLGMPLAWWKQIARPYAGPAYMVRQRMGLPRGNDPFFEEYLGADLVLALFSPLLARRMPDWPPTTVVTGFVRYDEFPHNNETEALLERFLAAGRPPVVFTLSSDAVNAPTDNFYLSSLTAAKLLAERAVMLGLQLPNSSTNEVLYLNHASFSSVFSRAAAVICHGGIGTTAIALQSGKPILMVPSSFAQPDITARVLRLGVARSIPRGLYSGPLAALVLRPLLNNRSYRVNAAKVKRKMDKENGAAIACDALERLMDNRLRLQKSVPNPKSGGVNTTALMFRAAGSSSRSLSSGNS